MGKREAANEEEYFYLQVHYIFKKMYKGGYDVHVSPCLNAGNILGVSDFQFVYQQI